MNDQQLADRIRLRVRIGKEQMDVIDEAVSDLVEKSEKDELDNPDQQAHPTDAAVKVGMPDYVAKLFPALFRVRRR